MLTDFKDLFSGHAGCYAGSRPTYPPALFEWLAQRAPDRSLAWDCGTGNGQAAVGLAQHFDLVVATDASTAQLAHAAPHPRISYEEMLAEQPRLATASVGLITVAQALHWFRFDAFYSAVRRVSKPGGLLAAWCYNLPRVSAAVDAVCDHFYHDVVGRHWPQGREHIDACYRTIPFPFDELTQPLPFACRAQWRLPQYVAYLESWSAVQRFRQQEGCDPLERIAADLANAWGDDTVHDVRWPIHLRVGRVTATDRPS